MIEKLIKLIAVKIYYLGRREALIYKKDSMNKRAIIHSSSELDELSSIVNLSNKKENIVIGENCHISGSLIIYPTGGEIKIGNHCSLSENSRIVSGKKISIGNRVMIAHNVNILDNNSHPIDAKERHLDFIEHYTIGMQEHDLKSKEIIIHDDVWIGFNSTILKGVTIGRGAIIGAGSFVTKDVEEWTINVGNPCKCVKKLAPINEDIALT